MSLYHDNFLLDENLQDDDIWETIEYIKMLQLKSLPSQ